MSMSDKQSSNNPSFLKGLFLGSVAGFLAGVIFAPEKGEDTRKKIIEKKKEWEPRLRSLAATFKQDIDPFIQGFSEIADFGKSSQSSEEVVSKPPVDPAPQKTREVDASVPQNTSFSDSPKRRFFKVKR